MKDKNKIITDPFDDAEELIIDRDKEGISRIKGVAYSAGIGMQITITRNDSGNCVPKTDASPKHKPLYTGTISLLDPASTNVMISEVKRRKKEEKGLAYQPKDIYATIKYQCDSPDEERMSFILMRQIQTLLTENKDQLSSAIAKAMTPERVTPQFAADRYANEFLRITYPTSTPENNQARANAIKKTLSFLPAIPICKLKRKQVNAYFDEHHVTEKNRNLCSLFMEYLINARKISGQNPISANANQVVSESAIKKAAFARKTLSDAEFEKLFFLLNKSLTPIYCAIALLASGFSLTEIREFRWEDLEFIKGFTDFVIVHIRRNYTAVSKHDFSRPSLPDVALYLRSVYKAFCKERGKDAVDQELILPSDIQTAVITNEVNNLLVRAGFHGELSVPGRPSGEEPIPLAILRTNYQYRLISQAGLKDDPDTVSFLSGVMFKSSTYSSYESHTSLDSQKRLYTILKAVSVEKTMSKKTSLIREDDKTIYHAVPRTNHEAVKITGDIRVKPGQRIRILCPHGVIGYMDVDEATAP